MAGKIRLAADLGATRRIRGRFSKGYQPAAWRVARPLTATKPSENLTINPDVVQPAIRRVDTFVALLPRVCRSLRSLLNSRKPHSTRDERGLYPFYRTTIYVFVLCCNARELTFLTLPRHDVMEYNQQQNNTIKNTPRGPGARSPRKSQQKWHMKKLSVRLSRSDIRCLAHHAQVIRKKTYPTYFYKRTNRSLLFSRTSYRVL